MPSHDVPPPRFHGVEWDEAQLAWRASVERDGKVSYEDVYAEEEHAALGRELALLLHGWEGARNFPGETLEGLCRRLARELGAPLEDSCWHPWAARVGIEPVRFIALARAS